MNNQNNQSNYQDEYGITERIREIVDGLTSRIATMWVKQSMRQAYAANSRGEFSVYFNPLIEGSVHLVLADILDFVCPGYIWDIHESVSNPNTWIMVVVFPPGTMDIPLEFR